MIKAYSLYSGSSGNAYLIQHENTVILVDAGRSCAALCRAIKAVGISPEEISAVLITHEHNDHTSALKVFFNKYSPLLIGAVPVLSAVCTTEKMVSGARSLVPGRSFTVGTLSVCACFTPHDSSVNVSYRFTDPDGVSIAIATDMGEVTDECIGFLSGTACAVIEANHDPEMLEFGPYPPYLKSRILSRRGHLSNNQCADLATELAQAGTSAFVLAHMSRENNTPDLALNTVTDSLCKCGFGDIPVALAKEDATLMISVDKDGCRFCTKEDLP